MTPVLASIQNGYLDPLLLEAHDRLLLSSQLIIVLCIASTVPSELKMLHCHDYTYVLPPTLRWGIPLLTTKTAIDEAVGLAQLLVLDKQRVLALHKIANTK
jgi:hypothetical protein